MREQSEIDTAQIVKDFFLGEFSFDELKYDPENLPKGNRKELAAVIVDYEDNVMEYNILYYVVLNKKMESYLAI